MKKILLTTLVFTCLPFMLFAQKEVKFPEEDFLKIIVLFTNDMHGGIARTEAGFINPDFPPMLGNGPAVINYVKKIRQSANENNWGFLLLDAGDIFQGTPVGTLTKGKAVIDFMNLAQYDVMAIGNHDFDMGWQNLNGLSQQANFPFLGANLFRKSTGKIVEFAKSYIIKEIEGIKIGIVGVCTSVTPDMSFPKHVEDIEFRPEVPSLKTNIKKLQDMGINFIIAVNHTWIPYYPEEGYAELLEKESAGDDFSGTGVTSQEIAHAVPGIDVMFSGHVHKGFNKPWEEPKTHTLIFQNYANGSNLGHVNFYIHRKTGTLAGYDFVSDDGALLTLFEDEFRLDSTAHRIINNWVKKSEIGFDDVIGTAVARFARSSSGESPMGNLVIDATRIQSQADIAFTNFGGIRSDISSGPITPRKIFSIMPFGNRIVIMKVTGKFLRNLIEDRVSGSSHGMACSGCKLVIDRTKANGQRIKEFYINGKPVDDSKLYKLAVSDYLAEGNSGYDRLLDVESKNINYTGIMIRQALIDYIKDNTPLIPKTDGRWQEIK